jgi:hypothetical protein
MHDECFRAAALFLLCGLVAAEPDIQALVLTQRDHYDWQSQHSVAQTAFVVRLGPGTDPAQGASNGRRNRFIPGSV